MPVGSCQCRVEGGGTGVATARNRFEFAVVCPRPVPARFLPGSPARFPRPVPAVKVVCPRGPRAVVCPRRVPEVKVVCPRAPEPQLEVVCPRE